MRIVSLADGGACISRAVVLATGVTYRRLGVPSLDELMETGVFYGAASPEAQAMAGEEVYVVGGANSAGQAALHLARYARQVTLLVRGASLAATDVGLPGPRDRRHDEHRRPPRLRGGRRRRGAVHPPGAP
jgi:thioredoxin reductase (NADPH)